MLFVIVCTGLIRSVIILTDVAYLSKVLYTNCPENDQPALPNLFGDGSATIDEKDMRVPLTSVGQHIQRLNRIFILGLKEVRAAPHEGVGPPPPPLFYLQT